MTKTISMKFGPKMEKTRLDMFDKVLSSCHCACLSTSLFYIAMSSTQVHTHYCDDISSFRIQDMGETGFLFCSYVLFSVVFKHIYIIYIYKVP